MNKHEKSHLSKVAALGCIVCERDGFPENPSEIHHIRSGKGSKRASHYEVIPLCPVHHRLGGYGVAVHAGRKTWEAHFGTELELLAIVHERVGYEVGD